MSRILTRDMVMVSLAGMTVMIGLGLILPLFPIYIAEKGASNFQLGLIISGFAISQFLFQPFFGGLSDRFGRKSFMVGGLACYGVTALLYIFAGSLSEIFYVRLLQGVATALVWPALSAFIIDQSPTEHRGETMSLLSGVETVGFAIGPIVGGLLFGLGGMKLPFLASAMLAFLAMTLVWLFTREQFTKPKTAPQRWITQYGFSALADPDIRLLCLVGLAETFVWGSIAALLPVMASHLGIFPGHIGWLFTSYFIVYILLQRPVGKWSDREGRKKPILLGMSIYTLAILGLVFKGTFLYLLLILAGAGAGLGLYAPSVRVAVADLSESGHHGASFGIFFTARMLGFFLGPNLSGAAADRFGPNLPFLICTAILVLGIWAASALSTKLSKKSIDLTPGMVCPAGREVKRQEWVKNLR